MKSVCDVLHGQTPNALYPFLWVHGVESEEELRREVQKIRESGIGGFCVEARPHKDFNGPGWFRDLALLLDEAKRTGMEMWILDDSHFPTGFADGAVKREHPELCKKFLCCKTLDYAGPMENMTAVLKYALRDPRDKILAVTLSRKTAFETIDPTTTIDLTDKVYTFEDARTGEIMLSSMGQPLPGNPKEGPCVAVDFDLPDGQWTLNVITVSYKGGEKQTEGYLNPLDSAATKVLLDTVYEPIYAHFGEEFGKTLCGFFSDEPRLGNIHGAEDAAIGHNSAMNLPWRDGMENLLAGKLAGTALTDRAAGNIRALLPLLFLHSSNESAHVAQYTYMDLVSQLYSDNFDGVLAAWCHAHHCEHIGHTIEDNNATARLGYGAGHFYRAMAHQDMSGIDVVIQQLLRDFADRRVFDNIVEHSGTKSILLILFIVELVQPIDRIDRRAIIQNESILSGNVVFHVLISQCNFIDLFEGGTEHSFFARQFQLVAIKVSAGRVLVRESDDNVKYLPGKAANQLVLKARNVGAGAKNDFGITRGTAGKTLTIHSAFIIDDNFVAFLSSAVNSHAVAITGSNLRNGRRHIDVVEIQVFTRNLDVGVVIRQRDNLLCLDILVVAVFLEANTVINSDGLRTLGSGSLPCCRSAGRTRNTRINSLAAASKHHACSHSSGHNQCDFLFVHVILLYVCYCKPSTAVSISLLLVNAMTLPSSDSIR